MRRDIILSEYMTRYDTVLSILEKKLLPYIAGLVGEIPRVDRITVRAKSPDRFVDKALKANEDDSFKYSDPLNEIQDQLGARITVFYLSDVEVVKSVILRYFVPIEITKKEPKRSAEFGYFGEHFILKVPDDVVPEELSESQIPEFFELQIKTLFQHAWSEADHDLAYKSVRGLDELEQRQIAFSAAQAWGADRLFEELARKLVPGMTGH